GKAEADYVRRALKVEVSRVNEVYDAKVKWAEYLAWGGARRHLGFDEEWRSVLALVDDIHRGRPVADACDGYAARRAASLGLQAELIDFRLYWDRLSRALEGRDLLLIDAEKVGGRRTLFMLDPEQFRVPVPVLLPQGGAPQRAPFESDKGKGHDGP